MNRAILGTRNSENVQFNRLLPNDDDDDDDDNNNNNNNNNNTCVVNQDEYIITDVRSNVIILCSYTIPSASTVPRPIAIPALFLTLGFQPLGFMLPRV